MSQKSRAIRPILLLEVNEVPWRLLDRYLGHRELPHLTRFFAASQTFTTRATDEGELSPWITWPSFHRGIPNTEHGVQFLGQDPATFRGVAIWEEYRKRGYSIGIGGSLQSWPPRDPGPGGFYIPDTFAQDERCIPSWVSPFQKFNLQQTRENGRVVNNKSVISSENMRFALTLPKLGIRPRTCISIAKQLIAERKDRNYLARPPIYQAVLLWDIFRKLYSPHSPPAFSTFFTNHVAGVMHRYWHQIFPEDYGETYKGAPTPHVETMLFAMKKVDAILQDAMHFCELNPEIILVFASSMGQAAKIWKRSEGHAFSIPQIPRLIEACGLTNENFKALLAMVPQICVQIPDRQKRADTRDTLLGARTASEKKLFAIEELHDRLSISIITPDKKDVEAGYFTLAGRVTRWEEAGIQVNPLDSGTAYHIPEGSMAIYGNGMLPGDLRTPILATEAKNRLLKLSGIMSS